MPGSTQPINPATVGLGKFSSGAGAPWLNHAMRDVGSNPTGWKRQWCAKSMNIWLQKSGRKLIWPNPLLRYEGYEPISTGAKAMMPHVDDFRAVHNLESLAELTDGAARGIRGLDTGCLELGDAEEEVVADLLLEVLQLRGHHDADERLVDRCPKLRNVGGRHQVNRRGQRIVRVTVRRQCEPAADRAALAPPAPASGAQRRA